MEAKPFDQWSSVKKRLETRVIDNTVYCNEREVWWSSIGVNIGVETDGKNEHFERPVLILKKFNRHMLWVLPLTSKYHEGPHYYPISYERGISFACLWQLRTISSKRLLRKIAMISEEDFVCVREKVIRCIIKSRTPG